MKSCRENQNAHFVFNSSFPKSYRLWYKIGKYGTASQDTDDNIIWRMRIAYWITKATDAHAEYVILIAFHGNNGYPNAPQLYVYTYMSSALLAL
jgi:hypothetical protein